MKRAEVRRRSLVCPKIKSLASTSRIVSLWLISSRPTCCNSRRVKNLIVSRKSRRQKNSNLVCLSLIMSWLQLRIELSTLRLRWTELWSLCNMLSQYWKASGKKGLLKFQPVELKYHLKSTPPSPRSKSRINRLSSRRSSTLLPYQRQQQLKRAVIRLGNQAHRRAATHSWDSRTRAKLKIEV